MKKNDEEVFAEISKDSWRSNKAAIYFISSGDDIAIKIGVVDFALFGDLKAALSRRINAIQTCNHTALELLGVIVFSRESSPVTEAYLMEKRLHNELNDYRIFKKDSRGSEWFKRCPEVIAVMRREAQSLEEAIAHIA